MSKWMSGRDALRELNARVSGLRTRLNDSIQAADGIEGRLAEIQSDRVDTIQKLAQMRLDVIRGADVEDLDKLHRRALELLHSHSSYVDDEREAIEEASAKISELEEKRSDLAGQQETLEATIQTKLEEVQTRLEGDKAYQDLMKAFEDAEAIADRADQKLAVAIEEREEKAEDYLNDLLFSYLWESGYGTTDYKRGGLFKMLDQWVARLCKYDEARPNFVRMNDLTEWLDEHAIQTREGAKKAEEALEAFERSAIEKAGVTAMEQEAETLQARISEVDAEIEAAEARHIELTELHAKTLTGEDGPARQARRLLEDGLQKMTFPDLRKLAAETLTLDDDEIVDDLVELRTEEMSLEIETERVATAPTRIGKELKAFEDLRRRYKQAHFDSDAIRMKRILFAEALESLSFDLASSEEAFKRIVKSVRRAKRPTRDGFGGRRRSDDIEIEDVLTTIAIEALRQGVRHAGRSGGFRGFPTSSRGSSRRSRPRRRSGGGGFKTGGGF